MRRLLALLLLVPSFGWAQPSEPLPKRLVESGYAQIGVTLAYDPSYRQISFPDGDVPLRRRPAGQCLDPHRSPSVVCCSLRRPWIIARPAGPTDRPTRE